MIFHEKKLNKTGSILYIDHYHPCKIEGKENPRADDLHSKVIRNVKNGVLGEHDGLPGIEYVVEQLAMLLSDETTFIIPMPSSDPSRKDTGIEQLISLLCQRSDRIDGRGLIYRSKDISDKTVISLTEKRRRKKAKRCANVQEDSLSLSTDALVKLKLNRVLIVDDVCTSGASLEGIRRLLQSVEVEQLEFLVLGRAYNHHNFDGDTSLPDSYENIYYHIPDSCFGEDG